MEILTFIFDYIAVPLYLWVWWTDRKIVRLESQNITNDDLEKIYTKLDDIKENMNQNFVSSKSCNFRHKI